MKAVVNFSATKTQYTWRCEDCRKVLDKVKIKDYEALSGSEKLLAANAMLQTAEEHECATT